MDGPFTFSITQVAPLNNYSGLTQNVSITNPAAAAAAQLASTVPGQAAASTASSSSFPAGAWIFVGALLLWLFF